MKRILILTAMAIMLSFAHQQTSFAQCAMCKATLETKAEEARNVGAGINTGILYLMVVPYISFAVLAYMWYKNQRKKPVVKWKKDAYHTTAG